MMYKSIGIEYEFEGQEFQSFYVCPEHVRSEDVVFAEAMGEGEFEAICEAFSQDDAELISRLLNAYAMAGHA